MEKQEIIHYALMYFCNMKHHQVKYYLVNNINHIIVTMVINNKEYHVYFWDNGTVKVFEGSKELL